MTRASATSSAAYFERLRLSLKEKAEMMEAAQVLVAMKESGVRRSARIAARGSR